MWKERFEAEISSDTRTNFRGVNYLQIGVFFVASHILGIIIMNSAQTISRMGLSFGYNTETSIYFGFGIVSVLLLIAPVLLVRVGDCQKSMKVLNILSLLELGTLLICVSMMNFSMALYTAVIYAPLALFIGQSKCR